MMHIVCEYYPYDEKKAGASIDAPAFLLGPLLTEP